MKSPRILIFNPGHEMVPELIGKKPYVPPPVVRRMMRDLGSLPMWLADNEQDRVLCPEGTLPLSEALPLQPKARELLPEEYDTLPLSSYTWEMWGQSPVWLAAIQQHFPRLEAVVTPPFPQELYDRSHRREAVRCLKFIGHEALAAHWYTSVEDFQSDRFLRFPADTALLVKLPASSSGRGLIWLSSIPTPEEIDRLRKATRNTDSFSVEKVLDVQQDWAAEFYSDGKGELAFVGLSRFDTNRHGAYLGNRLAPQKELMQTLVDALGYDVVHTALSSLQMYLQERFSTLYTGYIGVDMVVYKDGEKLHLHPCIEINVRYTMGVAAILLYDLWVEEGRRGRFEVKSFRTEREAYEWDQMMQHLHPPQIHNHRLCSGYIPLTSTAPSSRFLAYLLVSPEDKESVKTQ